jgi:hypothetical protein
MVLWAPNGHRFRVASEAVSLLQDLSVTPILKTKPSLINRIYH